ncbi:glycosyltransferase [Streptococcus halotolerans]|uniref:glycosyltransferase n=1 Tax=Streptococcus halotolerans TaxID=1814128 RepID=UPI000786ECC1|nr:glycosyltransferase [Streptococcus halotolerans]
MVKTAVLMATYNGQSFITEQLDSIRQQTLKPDYVLIRDDCSTDDTIKVVNDYISKYNLNGWTINKNNSNLNWRLNFRELLRDSRHLDVDYLFFSDQDDTWYLDKNKTQVDTMDKNKNITVLSGDIEVETIGSDATIPQNFQFDDAQNVISKYPEDMTYHNYRQGWTFCIRKNFADLVIDNYLDNHVLSHDNLMTGISGVLGSGYNLNKPVGLHKRHGGNASGNLLNIKSSRNHHLQDLTHVSSYYQILLAILEKKNHKNCDLAKAYLNFALERLENAEKRNWIRTIKQVMTQKKYYDNFSNRMRDIVFLFKK